jgi:tetratricopeptide (TPR) repeat protein
MKPCWSFFLAVLFCQSAGLTAQSLAEVARRERERRKSLHEPKAVYTNVDPERFSKTGSEVEARETQPSETESQQRPPSPQPREITVPLESVEVEAPAVMPVSFTPASPEPAEVVSASPQCRAENFELGYRLMASSQHAEAADVFRELLRTAPSDREARLALGRVYARGGRDAAARREFETLLVVNPSDTEAMLGIAQTYQWSGVGPLAREWYEKALALDAGLQEAEIGLGYIELWREPALAAERSLELEHRFPSSANVGALREEARKVRAPQFQVSFDRLRDTQGNELDIAWFESRSGLSSPWDLWIGGAFYDMTFQGEELYGAPGSGSIASFYTLMGRPTAPGQRIDLRVGLDYRKDTLGATDLVAIGGAAWSWGLDRTWSGRVAYDRDSFRYTTKALDGGIVLNAFSASLSNRFAPSWVIEGEVGYWDVDDKLGIGNRRLSAGGGLRYKRLFKRKRQFEAGYHIQYFAYRENFGASFFSPSFYRGHRFEVSVAGPIGRSLFDYHAWGSTGIQSYDQVSTEPMWTVRGHLGVRLGSGYRLEVFGIRGDYLMLTDFPVTSEQFGVRVRWQGGVR